MATIINDTSFKNEVLDNKELPVLVDFWASWCVPCKMLAPILDELEKEYDGKFKYAKLEIDESPNTPSQLGIMSIPTIIIFKGGKEVFRSVGVQTKSTYQKALDQFS